MKLWIKRLTTWKRSMENEYNIKIRNEKGIDCDLEPV